MSDYTNARFICEEYILRSVQLQCPGQQTYGNLSAREVYQTFDKIGELARENVCLEKKLQVMTSGRDDLRAENERLKANQREDVELMQETLEAEKMGLAAIDKLRADNSRLRHLLTVSEQQRQETMDGLREVAAARDAAEARLGALEGVLEGIAEMFPPEMLQYGEFDDVIGVQNSHKLLKLLQSPAAKAVERAKAAEWVYEALNDLYWLTNELSIDDKDYRKVTNAAAALAAYEGVKGE